MAFHSHKMKERLKAKPRNKNDNDKTDKKPVTGTHKEISHLGFPIVILQVSI